MRKKHTILWIVVSLVSILLILILIIDTIPRINGLEKVKRCRDQILKNYALAFQAYKVTNDDTPPPNLLAVVPYIPGGDPNRNWAPQCCGNREGEDSISWPYVYRIPVNDSLIEPLCWDSKKHRMPGGVFPDICRRNVLFEDGHIETINEKKFLKLMSKFDVTDPNTPLKTDM